MRYRNGHYDDGAIISKRYCPNCGSDNFVETISLEHCLNCKYDCDYWGFGANPICSDYLERQHMTIPPGNYIWHGKDHDQEVKVIKSLGEGSDGRIYVQIEGTNVGIPWDECSQIQKSSTSKKPLRSSLNMLS